MLIVCDTVKEFEAEAEKWTLKFPRKYRAERIRGLPSMRQTFDHLFRAEGVPPSPEIFSQAVWDGCTNVKQELEDHVKARARRAHPSFVREAHFYLVLKDKLQNKANIKTSAELDMHFKTDFLISALESPIEIRLHTYTDTRRGNKFAAELKKEPVTVDTYNPLSGENEKEAVVADMRLPIIRGVGKELSNGLWLYNSDHAAEVEEYLDHLTQEFENHF
jgi:hypothetical protein